MELALDLRPTVSMLVEQNLVDAKARHLMLLTTEGRAVPLLFAQHLIPPSTPVLVGSAFPDD
eukprot:3837860-Amphidinium_carterae.1